MAARAAVTAVIFCSALIASCGGSGDADLPQTCPECASEAGEEVGTEAGMEAGEGAALEAAADSLLPEADASTADQAIPEAGQEGSIGDGPASEAEASAPDALPEAAAEGSADATSEDAVAVEADAPDPDVSQPETGADAPVDTAQQDSPLEADVSAADAPGEAAIPEASTGIITGGPCLSGAPGQTAYRLTWIGSGSYPQLVYEVNGLPDKTDHAGVYGYNMGFTPQFVDPYLGDGGLLLDSSDFIDIELSTVGVSSIKSITLSIRGRSYNTTTSGSFGWQTFEGGGSAPYGLVSNSAPYEWYSVDMTGDISAGNDNVLLRIKAGPPSGSLVVNRLELCMQAE